MSDKNRKKPRGRNPYNEDLAANRAKWGRSGYEQSKKAYRRKNRNQKPKHSRWEDYMDDE